jgi:ABC-type sugar transport system, ATPase component
MVPLMAIWRNFFLGSEPRKGFWPLKRFDKEKAKKITRDEMLIWALTFAIQTSQWERCPAVSGNAWLSLARCTSARGC